MNKITRLRRISWKSKNNVYGLKIGENDLIPLLEKYIFDHFKDVHLDILILPKGGDIDQKMIAQLFPQAEIIEAGIQERDNGYPGSLVEESIAEEIVRDILRVDSIKTGLYAGASAKIAMERGERYEWKNIGILL